MILQIRDAIEQDAPAIYTFLCDLEEETLDLDRFMAVYQYNLTNPAAFYLIAERADEVVGFVSCYVQYALHHVGKVGEIQELYVRPDCRNERIGRQLITAITELSHRENLINLEVTTNQKRADTVRFYEREGFQRTHYKLVKPVQI
ncbi:GNAT family N-acetyltransferase [Spirosoma montaniterrae]|uniref:GCN5 family acetyltransferase n=1 Tax=Spirosoma montaniterrae TaxID=1178516 RepID=A0A1P9WRH4_9BACT|nr:GNAT family N-acetyltransferase [Spirosoma montaniterrae]AQG77968.1 GCN5 family acetyltransferase [Spirosoma montaniterrae]